MDVDNLWMHKHNKLTLLEMTLPCILLLLRYVECLILTQLCGIAVAHWHFLSKTIIKIKYSKVKGYMVNIF